MIEQGDMLDDPIAHTKDPVTAKAAAHDYNRQQRKNDIALMIDLLTKFPGRTSAEYAEILFNRGVNFYRAAQMPQKRISDLKRKNLVRVGTARKCKVTSNVSQIYYLTGE